MENTWDNLIVGQNIASMRKRLGMSQEQLAEKCDISTQTIHRIEHGLTRVPGASTFYNICKALGCTPDDLINQDGGD